MYIKQILKLIKIHTFIWREDDIQREFFDLLREDINFIEEQNHWAFREEHAICNAFK